MTDDQFRSDYAHHLVDEVRAGRMSRRQLLVRASVFGFSATAAGSLLAACGGSGEADSTPSASTSSSASEPVMGGTLKVALNPSITDLDPLKIYDQGGIVLMKQFCEYLAYLNEDFSLGPQLAESWSPNETGDVWTFNLRQGVTFNDGSPLEAEDVVTSMDRCLDPKEGSAALAALEGILSPGGSKAVDTYTVEFHLDKPFADFPYLVCPASYNTMILPRSYKGDWVKNPVGTGPWTLKEYVAKQRCVAVKNPTYWGKDDQGRQLPYMDQVEWNLIADASASTLQLQSGAIDLQAETVYQGSQALFSDPNLKVQELKGPGIRELFFNVNEDPWTDKRVRQAVALCLDRDAINTALFDGKSVVGYDSFYQTPPYPDQPPTLVRKQDYDQAKQLLSDAGYENGLDVTLSTEKFLEVPQYAQLIQQQCKPAGINVKIDLIDYNTWYAGDNDVTPWLNANFGIVEWGPRPTPAVYTQFMLLPTSAWSSSHWDNEEFNVTFDKYMSTTDEAERMGYATTLSQIQQDETPIVVAFYITQLRAMKKNVFGVVGPGSWYCYVDRAYVTA
jgi:peptide/nickel transport system substrate-binding protein